MIVLFFLFPNKFQIPGCPFRPKKRIKYPGMFDFLSSFILKLLFPKTLHYKSQTDHYLHSQ